VVGDALTKTCRDVAVDAVETGVLATVQVPAGKRRFPLVELGRLLEPADARLAFALPELVDVELVDLGLGVCLRGEVGRGRVPSLRKQHGVDRTSGLPVHRAVSLRANR
jgi:hypothetical protein